MSFRLLPGDEKRGIAIPPKGAFASPIMTAALSHLEQMGEGGMAKGIAEGALNAGCVMWYGAAEEAEIEMLPWKRE